MLQAAVSSEGMQFNAPLEEAWRVLSQTQDNVFITGQAGTGKSTFLDYIQKHLNKRMAVLAPTGVAALNVRGQTLHSFFRFKPRLLDTRDVRPRRNRKLYEKLELLVVDEISMVRADMFHCMDTFLRLNGPSPLKPFGGVQLCIIGDMYQLPPVLRGEEEGIFSRLYDSPYVFSAPSFDEAAFGVVELTTVYRQGDGGFLQALHAIRRGDADAGVMAFLNERVGREKGLQQPIVLTTTNRMADAENMRRMHALPSAETCLPGQTEGEWDIPEHQLPAPKQLTLKVGAQVMFTKNDAQKRWVNGTLGEVTHVAPDGVEVRFTDQRTGRLRTETVKREIWENVRYTWDEASLRVTEEVVGLYRQFPLLPAWAITIHKSQGKTLDEVVLDLGYGAFAPGQLYVGLSRCRSLSHLALRRPVRAKDMMCDARIQQFMRAFVG